MTGNVNGLPRSAGPQKPDFLDVVRGHPDVASRDADSAAPGRWPEDVRDPVGLSVDPLEQRLGGTNPHAKAVRMNVAAGARHAGLDRGGHPIRLRVDATDGAVALVQRPDRPSTGRDEPRLRTHWNRRDHGVGLRVDALEAAGP